MQDRIPLYPGRVKMTPVAGQANTYDMTRADDPTQAGTPLNKATLLKDATAALFGLGTGAVPDDVLAELGKYKQYWWRRRVPKTTGYIEKVATQGSTFLVQYNVTPVTYTYGDLSIDQSTGAVSISNAQTITLNIYSSVSDFYVLVGKYFTPDKTVSQSWGSVKTLNAGTIYRITDSSYIKYYSDEDSTYVYSQHINVITSIYSEGEPGDWQYLQSSNRNAYPDSGTQDGYEYEYLGVPFDNAVTAPKIEMGSYVGTGTYGQANHNTLTFGFVPKFVWIYEWLRNDAWYDAGDITKVPFGIIPEGDFGRYFPPCNSTGDSNTAYSKRVGTTLSWYNKESAGAQLNYSDSTYYYVAIG